MVGFVPFSVDLCIFLLFLLMIIAFFSFVRGSVKKNSRRD